MLTQVVRGCPVRNGLIDFCPPAIVNSQIAQVDRPKILVPTAFGSSPLLSGVFVTFFFSKWALRKIPSLLDVKMKKIPDIREVPPDVIFGLYKLTLRLWKNGANSAVRCIRRLRLWACTHVEYGWVALGPRSASVMQVSPSRRRCIRIRIRFVSMSVAEPKVNV